MSQRPGGGVTCSGFWIPNWPGLVVVTIAAQGFDFGNGPCLGTIRLTDTVDLQIR